MPKGYVRPKWKWLDELLEQRNEIPNKLYQDFNDEDWAATHWFMNLLLQNATELLECAKYKRLNEPSERVESSEDV